MRFALVGYGRMGREIEAQAVRRGHRPVRIVDPVASGSLVRRRLDRRALRGVEVAFEFTAPDQAEANVIALLDAGVAVVSGTTGWQPGKAVRAALRAGGAAAVIAPNFSVGMNLFYQVVREAAVRFGASGLYDAFVVESHHRGKLDAPSGTARKLATLLTECDPRYASVQAGNPSGALAADAVHVASVRAGFEPGTHVVGYDGEYDVITLQHRARGRAAFALGAVLAGEWVRGRRGLHGFDPVLRELLSPSKRQSRKGRRQN